jgi:transcriptional regulator with XRE-family HTH domain
MDFWERLRDAIKDKDLTQEWLARKTGVPIGTFKNWLTRETYPNAQQIADIAKLLNTSVEYLVTGAERVNLVGDERQLLANFRLLSKYEQEHITVTLEAWTHRFTRHS